MTRNTSLLNNALLWTGGAIAVPVIMMGTFLAPLGWGKAMTAAILGHLIGCIVLYLVTIIGARTGRTTLEAAADVFGQAGSRLFASLNVIQLVGWTSIMIFDAALAANGISQLGVWAWALITGALIFLWIFVGLEKVGPLTTISVILLAILCLYLSVRIFASTPVEPAATTPISFGMALEIATVDVLSWVPIMADYTRTAHRPVAAARVSVLALFLTSIWMFAIGIGAGILTATSDFAEILLHLGLGFVGLLIIIFSTVTTTFLDAWSSGVSATAITHRFTARTIALAVTCVGTVAAMFLNMDSIIVFLTYIGAVFAPMAAVMIVGHTSTRWNLSVWLFGFLTYLVLPQLALPIGSSLPVLLITAALAWAGKKIPQRNLQVT
ncbi:MAG: cytosine permease [Corynebacterium sp.]|nr:cytosine permease [Corynebacterium sp.]